MYTMSVTDLHHDDEHFNYINSEDYELYFDYKDTEESYVPLEWASFFFLLISITASLIGACLGVILMSSSKYRSRSYSVYFRFMVVTDFLCVFLLFLIRTDDWLATIKGKDVMIIDRRIEVCVLLEHLLATADIVSIWLLVASLIDHYVALAVPSLRRTWNSKSRAVIVSLGITFGSLLLVIVLLLTNIRNVISAYRRHGRCDIELSLFSMTFENFLKIVVGLAIPLPIVLAMSVKIVRYRKKMPPPTEADGSSRESHLAHSSRAALCGAVIGFVAMVTMTPMLIIDIAGAVIEYDFREMFDEHYDENDFHQASDVAHGVARLHNHTGKFHNISGEFHDEILHEQSAHVAFRVFGIFSLINFFSKFLVLVIVDAVYREDLARLWHYFVVRRHCRFDDDDDSASTHEILGSSNDCVNDGRASAIEDNPIVNDTSFR